MFSPIQNKKVHHYVVEQIQQQIHNGDLKRGDKLPSERDLTEQMQVSRSSVREALRVLEVTGLIESRQGEGNYISGAFENAFFEPLSAMFTLNHGKPRDLFELRSIIEIQACGLAAERITDEQIEELDQVLSNFLNADSEEEKVKYDIMIHHCIAEITDNVLLINMLQIISMMIERFIETNREKILENPQNGDMLIESHKEIVEAVKSRDPLQAQYAMKKHMKMIEDYVNPS